MIRDKCGETGGDSSIFWGVKFALESLGVLNVPNVLDVLDVLEVLNVLEERLGP